MSKLLNVSSSPHVRNHETTYSIMLDVATAMLPATAFGMYHFGMCTLLMLIVTIAACVLSEHTHEKLMERPGTIGDCSALITDLTLTLSTSPEILVWIPALGGIFATIAVKQLHGGLGQNLTNPVPVARCFLLISFMGKVTNFSYSGFDGVSGTTFLAVLKSGGTMNVPTMFMGNIPGTTGEVSVIALLIDTAYPLAGKVVSIRIPGTYISTAVVFTILFGGHGFDLSYIVTHLCGSSLILGAFLIATNYVTSPVTPKSQIVFGTLLGALTGLFRIFGGSAEGVSYATIISNIFVPPIEKVTLPKAFGKEDK